MNRPNHVPRGRMLAVGAVIVLFVVIFFAVLVLLVSRGTGGASSLRQGVGLLRVEGFIGDSEPYLEQLGALVDRDGVPALVVRIDSPGGGAAASQEVFSELMRIRGQGTPVVVSMGTSAASGGYYIACAADVVFANPGTVTGSIGVISEIPNTRELFEKLGIRLDVVKSGRLKDAGNPARELTPADRRLLQAVVDDIHDQFRSDVARCRELSPEADRLLADGRIVTGRQALALGLVDTLGSFNDAVRTAGAMAGIDGMPRLIEKKERNLVREWLYEAAGTAASSAVTAFFEKKYLHYTP